MLAGRSALVTGCGGGRGGCGRSGRGVGVKVVVMVTDCGVGGDNGDWFGGSCCYAFHVVV